MRSIFYDDRPLQGFTPRSIFLAGPTGRDVVRTPWRQSAVDQLSELRPEGLAILPEFRDRKFDREFFERQPLGCYDELNPCGPSPIPGLKGSTQNILDWETLCIDNCDVLLIWMPFSDELPGRTTRSEVARAIEQRSHLAIDKYLKLPKLVLGMPATADSGGHIRYHASKAGIQIHATLSGACYAAARLTQYYGDKETVPEARS